MLEPSGYALTEESYFVHQPGTPGGTNRCEFDASSGSLSLGPADLPALVGNTLKFSLNGGSPTAALTRTIPGYTTESVSFIAPSSHALAAAQLGQPLTLRWNPPATVAVYQVFVTGLVSVTPPGGGQRYCELPVASQSIGVPSATITLPSICDGLPVTSVALGPLPAAQIIVEIEGSHGELLTGTWDFN
jgi:hypothetical protein